jgi:hypothetical protein
MIKIFTGKVQRPFLAKFSPLCYQMFLLQPEQRTLVDESGMIRIQMGYNTSENGRSFMGRFETYHAIIVNGNQYPDLQPCI